MRYTVTNTTRAWESGRWVAVLILVLVAIALVPPDTLPYPPESDYSDASISHWPNAYFLRESVWRYGTWPLWNPLRMLGQPFAANPLSKAWYPPQWLVLLLPTTLHLNVMFYLHMAWLALGMFAWMRCERVHLSTALFATIAWGMAPKMIGHLGAGHLDIVYALAWVPWVFGAVGLVVDTPSIARGALAAGVAALLALADLRIAFYMLPVAAIYALSTSFASQQPLSRSWRAWAVMVVLFLLLTAIQTVPLFALGPYLTRASVTPHEAAVFSLPLRYLLGLLIPDLGGFQEWMTYLSLPVIGLAILALVQRRSGRPAWLWWAVAVIALLWALGEDGPLFLPVVRHLPLVGWFRAPSRAWFVVAISLVIASVYGLEALLERGLGRRGRLFAMMAAFAGGVWFVSVLVLPGLPRVLAGTGAAVFGTGTGLWLAGGGTTDLAVFFSLSARNLSKSVGRGVLLVTLTLSLLGVDLTLVRARSMASIERPEQTVIDVMGDSCGSIFSPTFDLIGPATARAGLATLHGIDPFQLRWSAENIAAAAGVGLDGYSVIAPPLPPGEIDPRTIDLNFELLKVLGVCGVVSRQDVPPGELPVYAQLGDVDIYRIPDAQVTMPPGYALEVSPSLGTNTLEVEACSDAGLTHIVIPQAWAPGWKAWVDAKPASTIPWNGLLAIGFDYSSGCHMVKASYRPLADFVGMGITGFTILGLAVWAILARWRGVRHA